MANVYIVNKSSHDFSAAEKYGDIVYLSKGPMNRYSTNNMVREFSEIMKDSSPYDYIVPCSLNVMNAIASAVFASMHHKLNLLLFRNGEYTERNHIL
jgi:hypothetical protein